MTGFDHHVLNELVFLRVTNGTLCARVLYVPQPTGVAPDAFIRHHLGWNKHAPAGSILHSTSWRYDPEIASIILTWAITPDLREDLPASPVDDFVYKMDVDAVHPAPKNDGSRVDSVAHAARHLAFLRDTDPAILAAIRVNSALRGALNRYEPDIARLHH